MNIDPNPMILTHEIDPVYKNENEENPRKMARGFFKIHLEKYSVEFNKNREITIYPQLAFFLK